MGMGLLRWVTGATLGALALACGGAASEPGAAGEAELDADDWSSEWRRLALPGSGLELVGITRTPGGWHLFSSTGSENYAYRSSDGVRWTRVQLPDDRARLTGIAYGGGRYVIVGHTQGAGHLIWVSTDGETWQAPPVTQGFGLDGVQFVEGRFFSWGLDIWSSQDAESWVRSRREDIYFPAQVAFGAGRYLLVGVGVPQLSSDGVSWSSAPIDCSLPSACISDVDEGTPFNQFRNVLFAEGHFYLSRLRSPDGQTWEEVAGPAPTSYLSGRFVRRNFAFTPDPEITLEAWPEGGTPQPIDILPAPEVELPSDGNIPESLDYSWSDGLDCTSARCVLLGNELYLIP